MHNSGVTDYEVVQSFQCIEGIRTFNLVLEEGFAGAFKTEGAATFVQGDFAAESGYPLLELSSGFPPQQVGGTGGAATQATRFLIRLLNVAEGVVPRFPNTVDEDATGIEGCPVESAFERQDLCLQRVEGANEDGAGGAPGDGIGHYDVPIVEGNGRVVYEVMNGDPFRPQDIAVPAGFVCSPGSPEVQLHIVSNLAPLSDEMPAPSGPVPRFVDTGGDPHSIPRGDIGLVKTADSMVVTPGEDQVVFTHTITNYESTTAKDVKLIDILPGGLTFVSASVSCATNANIVTCELGNLSGNGMAVVTITASVDADAAGTLINQASVTANHAEPTPDPHPNMDNASVVVETDLRVTALVGPVATVAGAMIDVSVDVTNTGGVAAGPFELGFFFSPNETVTTGDPASTITCDFPSGLAGSATSNCAGPIDVPAALTPGMYYLGAIVDVGGTVVEHNETNNSRVADTGAVTLQQPSCSPDVVRSHQTLSGTQLIEATSTATLGPNLIIDGDDIVVNAPTVSILSGTDIGGMFTVGTTPSCP